MKAPPHHLVGFALRVTTNLVDRVSLIAFFLILLVFYNEKRRTALRQDDQGSCYGEKRLAPTGTRSRRENPRTRRRPGKAGGPGASCIRYRHLLDIRHPDLDLHRPLWVGQQSYRLLELLKRQPMRDQSAHVDPAAPEQVERLDRIPK